MLTKLQQIRKDEKEKSVSWTISERFHCECNVKEMDVQELMCIMGEREEQMRSSIAYEYRFPYAEYFQDYEVPDLEMAYRIIDKFDLHDIVNRTMKGERTMIINDNEKLVEYTEDIQEYNCVTLHKRAAFIFNYIALIIFNQCPETLDRMGYTMLNEVHLIHNSFYENGVIKGETEISTFFDGSRVRVGRWLLKDIISKAHKERRVLYVPAEAIYPLNLCVQYNIKKEFQVVKSEMMQYVKDSVAKRRMCSILLYDAIPGAGKTYRMLQELKKEKKSIVVVPTKVQAQQLREMGYTAFTLDSIHHKLMVLKKNTFIMNVLNDIKAIYVDECFMMHSGQLRWVLQKIREVSEYQKVVLFGDKGQIPYYSFTHVVIKHSRDFQMSIEEVISMDTTYRCPQCFENILSYVYGRKITTVNPRQGVITYDIANENAIIKFVSLFTQAEILTFTQSEKDILYRNGIINHTIAEVQGQTFENVVLVRINAYERMVYYSMPHIVVALSRTKDSFMYCTVTADKTTQILQKIIEGDEEYDFEDEMKIGRYNYVLSNEEHKEMKNKVESMENQNCFSYQHKINTFSVRKCGLANGYIRNHVIMNEVHKDTAMCIKAMQLYMDQHFFKISPEYCTLDDYISKVLTMKETLENRGMRINQRRFHEALSKEKENYSQSAFYKYKNNTLKRGQFVISSVPKARIDCVDLYSLFVSMYKRNADPAQIRDFMMALDPKVVIKRFFDTFIDQEKFCKLENNINQFVKDYNSEWLRTRNIQQLNKLQYEIENTCEIDFTTYNAFIKTIIKNKYDETQYDRGQAAQIVAGAQAVMIQYFTPMVKRFSELLKNVCKSDVLINDGVNVEYMEWFVNYHLNEKEATKFMALEMDYSKFDKNQDWLDLYYQILILKEFGINQQILSQWISVHMITTLKFQQYGISMQTFTQRKSGDAFTFMGNTLFTMIMYAVFYSDVPRVCMMFGGDDSLILFKEEDEHAYLDYSEQIGAAFNMEIKYMNTMDSIMFASRFFVVYENHVYILPDILKQFLRFNRIAKSKEHVIAQQISSFLLDKQFYFIDKYVWDEYIHMLFSRYKICEEEKVMLEELLIMYLCILFEGKTNMLYFEFNKMRNATKEEMMKIRMRMAKKHDVITIKDRLLNTTWSWEKQFLNQYLNYEFVDIIHDNYVKRNEIVVNLYEFDVFYIVEMIIDKIRSICDKNKIRYKQMDVIEYTKERSNENETCQEKIIKLVKNIFSLGMINNIKEECITVVISERVKQLIDFDKLIEVTENTMAHIAKQVQCTFKVRFI